MIFDRMYLLLHASLHRSKNTNFARFVIALGRMCGRARGRYN